MVHPSNDNCIPLPMTEVEQDLASIIVFPREDGGFCECSHADFNQIMDNMSCCINYPFNQTENCISLPTAVTVFIIHRRQGGCESLEFVYMIRGNLV